MVVRWLLAGLMLALTCLPALAQERVGAASLVDFRAFRAPPGASEQELTLRDSVFFNDQVSTEPSGALRVTFIDGSVLNVGPDSAVTIDRFVFVPGGEQNGLAATASRGMFRFASGLMPDEGIEISTPTATLGVRGTILGFWIDPAVGLLVQAISGTTLIEIGGEVVAIDPGQFAYVDPSGAVTIGAVNGAIGPILRQFGFAFPGQQLAGFFRFLGDRSLVRYEDVIGPAGFPEEWWRYHCSDWRDDDDAASDEYDDEFASGCGGGRRPDYELADDEFEEPAPPELPEEEEEEEEECIECE